MAWPAPFEDLARFESFALPTEGQRMARRLAASMDELTAFYRALLPRMEAIAAHLAQWPVDALPVSQRPLLWLGLMFMEAAVAVELFKDPDVPDSLGAAALEVDVEGIERKWQSA
jgi:hypothetical protein